MDPFKLLQTVVSNPVVRDVALRGFAARDTALATRDAVLGILNLPTATDLASVMGRLRSLSSRLELLEDSVTRVDRGIAALQAADSDRSVVVS